MVLELGLTIRGSVHHIFVSCFCFKCQRIQHGFERSQLEYYFLFPQTCLAVQDLTVARIFICWCPSACIWSVFIALSFVFFAWNSGNRKLLFRLFYWTTCSSFVRYKALDVKNILTETVSHHILHQMLDSPMWVDLSNLLKDYLKFMDDHLRESADLTFLAYRHRNYSKVNNLISLPELSLPYSWGQLVTVVTYLDFLISGYRICPIQTTIAALKPIPSCKGWSVCLAIEAERRQHRGRRGNSSKFLSCKLPFVNLLDPLIYLTLHVFLFSSAFLKTWNLEFNLWSSRMKLDPGHWGSMKICRHVHGGHLILRKTIC